MHSMPKLACVFILIIFASAVMCQTPKSYEGYMVVETTPSESQVPFLQQMGTNHTSGVDIWQSHHTGGKHTAEILVSPAAATPFLQELRDREIPFKIITDDVGRGIEEDARYQSNIPPGGLESLFAQFNTVDQISAIIASLAKSYPDHVALEVYGQSFEGRHLQLLKISTPSIRPKEAIWIQGGVHGCEHIGPAVVLYIAMQLAIGFDESAEVFALVHAFDWYLVPLVNPDAYHYTLTVDRLWRKTRSYYPSSLECVGVDPNRNWDWDWDDSDGSSEDPCAVSYAGPSVFSESEIRSIANFVSRRLRGRFLLFIDFHSFTQRWLTPWGYSTKLPPNYQQQKELAEVAVSALGAVYGTNFTVGSSANALYTVSGGARDWMYGVAGATYSYTVELRDKGHYGFLLPKSQILPSVIETWAGVRALGLELLRI